jgi:histidine triad (HIT) family protein
MSDECVFCRIASGEIEAELVYEDDSVVAFNDLNPVAPVHVLVIPRAHTGALDEIEDAGTESLLGKMVSAAGRVAADLGVAGRGYRLVINQGRDAGQVIDHLHLHVIGGREMGTMA